MIGFAPARRVSLSLALAVLVLLACSSVASAALFGVPAHVSLTESPCGETGVLATGPSTATCTYSDVGSDTFTVPAGVTSADFVVVGGTGGHYFIQGDAAHGGSPAGDITGRPGGVGARATATLGITPGEALQIDVAGRGFDSTAASRSGGMNNGPSGGAGAPGGFGGSDGGVDGAPGDAGGASGGTAFNGGNGAGGGGASDVRSSAGGCAGLTCGLAARVIVAAGAGGGGGVGGQGNALGGAGGDGGGSNGADGGATVDGGGRGVSGLGATPLAGGAGGLNPARHAVPPPAEPNDPRFGGDGADGTLGAGGAGGAGNLPCNGVHDPPCQDPNATTSGGGAGGGAGGGLFGGGGGSGGGSTFGGGGGGGGGGAGGSGYVTPAAVASTLTTGADTPAVNAGNGQITVSWTVVTAGVPTLVTHASASVQVGGQISDTADLSGGTSPAGTITFSLYGPGDTSCSTPIATSTATAAGPGSYTSQPFDTTASGTYRWVASYGGDGDDAAVSGVCGDPGESVVVTALPTAFNAYVANGNSPGANRNAVGQFTVLADGALSAKTPGTVAASNAPVAVAMSPDRRSVYIANQFNQGSISQYTVAPDGKLTPKSPVSIGARNAPAGIAITPDGQTAYVTCYAVGQVAQYSIAPNGTLSFKSPQTVAAQSGASGIAITPDGQNAYVTNFVANTISQYSIAPDGTLSAKSPATIPNGRQSRGITVSPDGKSAYAPNIDDHNISLFDIAVDGTLSPKSPATVAAGTAPGAIALTPDGKNAYVPDGWGTEGAREVSQYSVAADGMLSPKSPPTVTAGNGATGIGIHPDGTSAYVVNIVDQTVSQFAIGPDGRLSLNSTAPTGAGSYGIVIGQSPPPPPVVTTGAATAVTAGGATVAGTVDPSGQTTTLTFEYGTSTAFGSIGTVSSTGPGGGASPQSEILTGLAPNTTYYYRLVATNAGGTTSGPVRSFRTPGPLVAPVAVTLPATSTADDGAVVAGQVNPGGQATSYTFEYGTTASFGAISAVVALDDADLPEDVSASLGGLQADARYFYRVVATNPSGTSIGVVRSFTTTTGTPTAPAAVTGDAIIVTSSGATLAGTVDPHGAQTAFTFEYGPSSALGSITAVDRVEIAGGPQAVALPVTGLAPRRAYRYRIVASSSAGTTAGELRSFTTAAAGT